MIKKIQPESSDFTRTVIKMLEATLLILGAVFLSVGVYWKLVTKVVFITSLVIYVVLRCLQRTAQLKPVGEVSGRLNIPILAFLFCAFLSVITSRHVDVSQEIFFQRYLLYFGFFLFGAYLSRRQKNVGILVACFLAGAFLASIGGMLDIAKDVNFHALRTSFGYTCLFGSYFLSVFAFVLAYVIFSKSRNCRLAILVIIFPILYCFLSVYSRTAWIALMIGVVCAFAALKVKRRQSVYIVIFLCLAIVAIPEFRYRLFSPKTFQPITWGDRVPMWTAAVRMFFRHPLFGNGLGSYGVDMYTIIDPHLYTEGHIHSHAHNLYLEILAEMGVCGLISFLFIFVRYFHSGVRILRSRFDRAGFAIFLLVIAVLVNELTSSTILVGFYPPALFWFFLGMSQGERGDDCEICKKGEII